MRGAVVPDAAQDADKAAAVHFSSSFAAAASPRLSASRPRFARNQTKQAPPADGDRVCGAARGPPRGAAEEELRRVRRQPRREKVGRERVRGAVQEAQGRGHR